MTLRFPANCIGGLHGDLLIKFWRDHLGVHGQKLPVLVMLEASF